MFMINRNEKEDVRYKLDEMSISLVGPNLDLYVTHTRRIQKLMIFVGQ